MAEEMIIEQPNVDGGKQNPSNTGDDYISKVHSTLKDNIEGFNKSPEEFRKLITTDSAYRDKVYKTLQETIEGFNKTPEDFNTNLGIKKKEGGNSDFSNTPTNQEKPTTDLALKDFNDFSQPKTLLPYKDANDKFNEQLGSAKENIVNSLNKSNDVVINHLEHQFQQKGLNQYNPRLIPSDNTITKSLIKEIPSDTPINNLQHSSVIPDEQIEGFKNDVKNHPLIIGKTIKQLKNSGMDDEANKLQASAYMLSRENMPNSDRKKQLNNVEALKNGDIQFDPEHNTLIEPKGFFGMANDALKKRQENENLFQIADSGNDELLKDYLNELNNQHDIDNPIPVSKNVLGKIGEFGGGVGPDLIAAGLVSQIPVAGEAGAAAIFAHSQAMQQHGEELQRTYNEELAKGTDPDKALSIAKEQAKRSMAIGALEGAVLGKSGGIGENSVSKAVEATGTLERGLNKAYKELGESTPAGIRNMAVAGGGQLLENASARQLGEKRDLGEGVGENMVTIGAMHFVPKVASLLYHGIASLKPLADKGETEVRNTILQGLSKVPTEVNANILNDLVENGTISDKQAASDLNDIESHKLLDSKVAPHVEYDKTRMNIQDLIRQRESLKGKLDKENGVDEAYHPKIKEEINSINDQIRNLSDISNKPVSESPQPQLKPTEGDKKLVSTSVIMPDEINHPEVIKLQGDNENGQYPKITNVKIKQNEKSTNTNAEMGEQPTRQGNGQEIRGGHPEGQIGGQETSEKKDVKSEENEKIKGGKNAIQEQSPGGVLQRQPEETGSAGGERGRMEQSQQGNEPAGTQPEESNKKSETEGEENKTVGISHDSMTKLAKKLGLPEPERGQVLSPEELTKRGQLLLKGGADVEKLEKDFKENGHVSPDVISVAKAHLANLAKLANDAYEKFGVKSKEFENANKEYLRFRNEVAKPIGSKTGESMRALQGETDIDTGNYVSLRQYAEDVKGKPLTDKENANIKDLAQKNKKLHEDIESLKNKLSKILDENKGENETPKTIKEKAKNIADNFRKLKQKPFVFKDENGNEVNIQSMGFGDWNQLVEYGAKIIEKTGDILEGVKGIIDFIKDKDWYKKLSEKDKDNFYNQLKDHFSSLIPQKSAIEERFIDKKDNKFDPKDARDIWNYLRDTYISKGENLDESISKTARDLNLSTNQIRSALEQPKGAKVITNEMYAKQYQKRMLEARTKALIQSEKESKLTKALKFPFKFFFRLTTFGHGTVGHITHAGMNIFKPSSWKTYWTTWGKSFKYAFGGLTKEGEANYEKAMADLKNEHDFIDWKRAGLAIDPTEKYDDYQTFDNLMGRIGTMGDRGFNALKIMRLGFARAEYDKLSDSEKADHKVMKEIATIINHATGTANIKAPEEIGYAFFAPRLEVSRWQRLIMQPAKAAKTFASWGEASTADKVAAKIILKRNAEIASIYFAGLAANQGILMATGSKQKINFTNPFSADWLKFKYGDRTIDFSGGIVTALDFLLNMAHIASEPKKDLKGKQRGDELGNKGLRYLRGKLSPFAGNLADVATHKDFGGNTLPLFDDKPSKGGHKLSWQEYAKEKLPIPVSEAFKESAEIMKERGMSNADISNLMQSIFMGAATGTTGVRILPDFAGKKLK